MTASTSIVTLSRVITGCGSILVICSRRSIVARAVIPAEPFDNLHLLLRNDLDRAKQHDQQENSDAQKNDAVDADVEIVHTRVTSNTMPSAPITRTVDPAGIGSALRA